MRPELFAAIALWAAAKFTPELSPNPVLISGGKQGPAVEFTSQERGDGRLAEGQRVQHSDRTLGVRQGYAVHLEGWHAADDVVLRGRAWDGAGGAGLGRAILSRAPWWIDASRAMM